MAKKRKTSTKTLTPILSITDKDKDKAIAMLLKVIEDLKLESPATIIVEADNGKA